MSQTDPYNLESTFMQDDQSRMVARQSTLQRNPTYSLAGNDAYNVLHHPTRTTSYVTAEYARLNPNYNQPETAPIWGLARPFPRVVRPGMRPRQLTAVSKQHVVPSIGSVTASTQGTQPVPQVQVTPSRPDLIASRSHLFPAHTWTPRQRLGTQSEPDSLHVPAAGTGTEPQRTSTGQRPAPILEEGAYSEQSDDQVRRRREARESDTTINRLTNAPTHLPSRHDFAVESNEGFSGDHSALARQRSSLSEDRSAIDAGRQRVQNYADTAMNEPALRQPTLAVDWEEMYRPGSQVRKSDEFRENATEQIERVYHNRWAKLRHKLRQPFAEFLGTFVTLTIGLAASVVHATGQNTYGNFLSADLAWGFSVMIGIYTSGGISGAHLNPAISIMLSLFRGFPWHHCYRYIIAQFLGAIAAGAVVYGLYHDTIVHVNGGLIRNETGIAFYTRPQDWISNTTAFFNEFVAGAVLSGVILALGDDSNAPPGAGMQAFIVGLLVSALSMAFSYNTGAALNPARDFGPRLVTLAAGYGTQVFTERNCWWIWGTWLAPLTGILVGAFVYDSLVFTGGESPVNYPGGQWRARMDMIKNLTVHGLCDKGKEKDEERY